MDYDKKHPMREVLKQKILYKGTSEEDVDSTLANLLHFIEGTIPDHVNYLKWDQPVHTFRRELRKTIFRLTKEFMFKNK